MVEKEADYVFYSNIVDNLAFCMLGIAISIYALYVEIKKEANPDYVAHCDFHENASCTRVLTSEYGKGFGLLQYVVGQESRFNVRNCNVGIIYFTAMLILGCVANPTLQLVLFYASILACTGCVYLAYVLFFILKDICVVCLITYLANFGVLYLNHARIAT